MKEKDHHVSIKSVQRDIIITSRQKFISTLHNKAYRFQILREEKHEENTAPYTDHKKWKFVKSDYCITVAN